MPEDIRINLLEHDTSRQQARLEILIIVFFTAVLAVTMLLVHLNMTGRINAEKQKNAQLQQELLEYRPSQAAMTLNQNIEQQLKKKSFQADRLNKEGIPVTEILKDIARSMPDGTTLININITDEQSLLKGYAPDFASTSRLIASLKKSSRFHDVKVLNAQWDENSGQVIFNIEMMWKEGKI